MESTVLQWMGDVAPSTEPRAELQRYLDSPRVADLELDVVGWWGVSPTYVEFGYRMLIGFMQRHQTEYPVLSRIARDYLAVPAASTESERLFSSEGLIVTDCRSSLATTTIENLQLVKAAYKRNGA